MGTLFRGCVVEVDYQLAGLRGAVARGIFGHPGEATRHYNIPDYLFARSPEEELEITRASIEATAGRKVDEAEVIAEARARSKELIERAGLENLLKPWQHAPS